jgi:integral membrane protein
MSLVRTDLGRFRVVSLLEGLSYVALVGVAMPLKYAAGFPQAVRIVGMIHGVLFVAFCIALFAVATNRDWPHKKSAIAMLAAILPLGAFWLERRLRAES